MRTRPHHLLAVLAVAAIVTSTAASPAPVQVSTAGSGLEASAPTSSGSVAAVGVHGVGRWHVDQVGAESYRLTWTSPRPLPVTNSRPVVVSGPVTLGPTQIGGDGRSVSVVTTSASAPDPDDFDVLLSGQRLDELHSDSRVKSAGRYRTPSDVTSLRGVRKDPGRLGPHLVESFDYRLAPTPIAGLPAKVEMLGHVVQPHDADDSSPLVVFLHGRHEACYQTGDAHGPRRDWPCRPGTSPVPSYLGYDYVQRLLATQGYVTVSISADAINAQDYQVPDGGAAARAALVERHLGRWARWVADGTFAADMDNVILVGHSRGGEGVDRASIDIRLTSPYRITGQVLIGPTDFGYQAAPYIPSVTVLPYCDGDVSDLEGQIFTDQPRDLTDDDTALHSSVLVMGANHNFFNSEWTPGESVAPSSDDWFGPVDKTCGRESPTRLSGAEQRKVGRTYIAGAVHLFASDDQTALPLFDGSPVSVASADFADVRSSAVGGGRELRRPGLDARLGPASGAVTALCLGRAPDFGTKPQLCSRESAVRTPHWIVPHGVPADRVFEMGWTGRGQQGGLRFSTPLDASAAGSLDLRTIVDPSRGGVHLRVALYDGSGPHVVLVPGSDGFLPALPPGGYSLSKLWAQTLRVRLAGVSGVDLTHLTRVDFVARSDHGRIWVLDAAAAPTTLSAIPTKRVARLNLGDVSQLEGDGPGPASLEVPYRITGRLDAPARVTVVTETDVAPTVRQLTLAPGSRAGTISIPYRADTIDDLRRRRFGLAVFATRGIMTDDYLGTATLVDDDPTPPITVQPVSRVVSEGQPAQWRVTLGSSIDYELPVVGRPVDGEPDPAALTVGDLPDRFVHRHIYPVPTDSTPLSKAALFLSGTIRAGRTSTVIELPTAADNAREGREAITLRIRFPGLHQPPREVRVLVRDAP